jgi:hypothetical protein
VSDPDARARRDASGIGLSSIWVAAAFLLPITVAFVAPLSTGDLAYGIRAGRFVLETGSILRVDVFTFTAWCDPWLNQQWGAHVALAATFDALGWLGLALLRAALAASVVAATYAACRAFGAERRQAAWLSLLSWLPHLGGALRASFFGLLLFAVLLWIVAGRVEHPSRLPWAVALMAVWVNVHGSFPFGILVLLIAFAEDRVEGRSGRRTIVVAGLCALATALNPFGPAVWPYVVRLSTNPLIREVIPEWQPPWTSVPEGIAFLAFLVLGGVAFVRNRRSLPWPAWLQLGIFLLLAASSVRNLFWAAIVVAVTLARLPWARRSTRADPRNRLNVALVGAFALLPLIAVTRWLPHTGEDPPSPLMRFAPEGLTQELRSILRPGEPFANPQSWGSWFELTLPSNPVYVDSRIELLPEDAQRASIAIAAAEPGWEALVEAIPVRVLVVDRQTEQELVEAMPTLETWRQVYADSDGLIFVRRGAPPAEPMPPCPPATG